MNTKYILYLLFYSEKKRKRPLGYDNDALLTTESN